MLRFNLIYFLWVGEDEEENKSNDRHDGMSSPAIPSITYDSLDDGKDCGPDTVYSIQQSGMTSNKLRYC